MTKINLFGFEITSRLEDIKLNEKKIIINTLNAHSYCLAKKIKNFHEALKNSNYLFPDGIGIVYAAYILKKKKINRITGYDLHLYLLDMLNQKGGKAFYLGSTENVLKKIEYRIRKEFSNIEVEYFAPSYKDNFSYYENQVILEKINRFMPDVLFIGLSAPKQEIWAYKNNLSVNAKIIASIGAVFDFYSGNKKRAPNWLQKIGLEWLHRSLISPNHHGKRNITSNPEFIWDIILIKLGLKDENINYYSK